MIRAGRLLFVLIAILAVAGPAGGTTRATAAGAPDGLHGFLLRVDESPSDVFSRTPSFAWNPVPGAVRYEFQLSTSDVFRENGIVFSDTSLTTPVAAPALMLPWITGEPHSLYARVRAVLLDTTTPWSDSVGFDMQPPAVPAPLPSYPGLLRWTPVDGASGYQVWFVDIPKFVFVATNVADEREFYTFHQAASWLGQVRWRIRAIRNDFNTRANGLPAVTHGAWSPVYSSVNPPFAVGPLKPLATVSDVVSTGARSSPAHRLMPGFVFGGNQSLAGASAELYRVYAFTDRGCLNRVFASATVGSPAYAPRVTGPLALPQTTAGITTARSSYLPDGDEGPSYTFDRDRVTGNESLPPVTPTTGLPAGATAPTAATPPAAAPAAGAPPASAPAGGSAVQLLTTSSRMGPPVDLWDTDWSNGGGYYWTVVPVEAKVPGALSTSVAAPGSAIGATTLPLTNAAGLAVGDILSIGGTGNNETRTIVSVSGVTVTFGTALTFGHGAGEPVTRTSGNIQSTDLGLAQDACAAGNFLRFGKESEPALTAGGELFASGLSPTGRLTAATDEASFYGAPLVAWTTALGADAYAVQWSKTRQPFVPETDPATGALGMMTLNTSAILPLAPGTWHYRVRGYSYSLPTGAQAMSWSDPQAIVATKPMFSIVKDAVAVGTKAFRVPAGGFSISVPSSWDGVSRSTAGVALKSEPRPAATRLRAKLKNLASGASALRFVAYDSRGASISSTLSVQASADRGAYAHSAWVKRAIAEAKKLENRVGPVACAQVSLPAGAGVRCALAVRAQGGRTEAAVLYFLRHRNATYSLTFTSSPAARAANARLFAAAARSFRFTL